MLIKVDVDMHLDLMLAGACCKVKGLGGGHGRCFIPLGTFSNKLEARALWQGACMYKLTHTYALHAG